MDLFGGIMFYLARCLAKTAVTLLVLLAIIGCPNPYDFGRDGAALPTYKVSYDGNGFDGGTVPKDSNNYREGDTIIVAPPGTMSLAGHAFIGWNTASDRSGMARAAGETFFMGDAGVTLYAQWTQDTYTINFLDHDGTNLSTQTVAHGDNASAPTDPTRTGYTFTGWSPSTLTNITEDTDFTAEYDIIILPPTPPSSI